MTCISAFQSWNRWNKLKNRLMEGGWNEIIEKFNRSISILKRKKIKFMFSNKKKCKVGILRLQLSH